MLPPINGYWGIIPGSDSRKLYNFTHMPVPRWIFIWCERIIEESLNELHLAARAYNRASYFTLVFLTNPLVYMNLYINVHSSLFQNHLSGNVLIKIGREGALQALCGFLTLFIKFKVLESHVLFCSFGQRIKLPNFAECLRGPGTVPKALVKIYRCELLYRFNVYLYIKILNTDASCADYGFTAFSPFV